MLCILLLFFVLLFFRVLPYIRFPSRVLLFCCSQWRLLLHKPVLFGWSMLAMPNHSYHCKFQENKFTLSVSINRRISYKLETHIIYNFTGPILAFQTVGRFPNCEYSSPCFQFPRVIAGITIALGSFHLPSEHAIHINSHKVFPCSRLKGMDR